MHAREVIVELLDTHVEEVGLTRRQVADLAGVNAGQLSNWLRAAGPLAFTKEGRVTDVVLQQVEAILQRQPPPRGKAAMERLAAVLRTFGPRLRLLACEPDAARRGEPIAADNPLFLPRSWDEEVLAEVGARLPKPIIVSGGPKTGKSTLLYWLQQQLERSSTVIFVDAAEYIGKRPDGADMQAAWKAFYNWLAERCEDQVAGGGYRAVWNEAEDFVPWLKARVLATTRDTRVVLLIDHLDRLGEHYSYGEPNGDHDYRSGLWEFQALDRAIRHLVEHPERNAALKEVVVVVSLDYHGSKGCPVDRRGSSLLGPRTSLTPVSSTARAIGPAEMGSLLSAAHPETARARIERDTAFEFCGGQVYLAQAYAQGADEVDSKRNVLAAAAELARVASMRWHDAQTGDGIPSSVSISEDATLRTPDATYNLRSDERRSVDHTRRIAIDTGLWAWGWEDPTAHKDDYSYPVHPVAAREVIENFLDALKETKEAGNS